MNNTGGSFSMDDDEDDFGTMLDRAAAASEDSGDLTGLGVKEEPVRKAKPAPKPEPQVEDTTEADLDALLDSMEQADSKAEHDEAVALDPNPEHEGHEEPEATDLFGVPDEVLETPQPLSDPIPQVSAEPEPEPEPEPVAPVAVSTPAPARNMRIPTEADQISQAATVIRVLDSYRSLSVEERSVVVQFVTNGEHETAEDDFVVVKVINADSLLSETMTALIEAYEHAPVERAFFALSLSTKVLHALGNLVSVFTQDDYSVTQKNLDYAREVVSGIEKLSGNEISFVKATGSVLAATKETPTVD